LNLQLSDNIIPVNLMLLEVTKPSLISIAYSVRGNRAG